MSVDIKLFLVDDSILNERVIPAVADFVNSGNAEGATALFRETVSNKNFKAALKSDRVIAEYLARESAALLEGQLRSEMLDDTTGEILKEPKGIRRRQAEQTLNRFLVLYACTRTPNGATSGISLNRGSLADYVRANSKWMDETLSLSNAFLWEAPDLKPMIGGDAKLLTESEASTLLNAFREVAPPVNEDLKSQYNTLKALLETAAHEPRYRILIWTI
jgi:hypothetical protein